METNTSIRQVKKFLGMVVENMPEMDKDTMQGWIENPTGLKKVLAEALLPPLEIWKTVKIGSFSNTDAIREDIKKAGMKIGDYANDILDKFSLPVEGETEINLVLLSVDDLGFINGAKYSEICRRAKEFGLELCPPEVGPQLRLQYKDQPDGQWVTIAMEPITDSGGDPLLFGVGRRSDDLWLFGNSDRFWNSTRQFAFVLP